MYLIFRVQYAKPLVFKVDCHLPSLIIIMVCMKFEDLRKLGITNTIKSILLQIQRKACVRRLMIKFFGDSIQYSRRQSTAFICLNTFGLN